MVDSEVVSAVGCMVISTGDSGIVPGIVSVILCEVVSAVNSVVMVTVMIVEVDLEVEEHGWAQEKICFHPGFADKSTAELQRT